MKTVSRQSKPYSACGVKKNKNITANILTVIAAVLLSIFTSYLLYEVILTGIQAFKADGYVSDIYSNIVSWGFLISSFVILCPFFLFIGWALQFKNKKHVLNNLPFVTIIIPAFNEQSTIEKSIRCALSQDYPNFEVIVVDDGSSDFTPHLIDFPEVKSMALSRNQGKANAVNNALQEANGELILFSDSDSHLHPSALRTLVGHFENPKIGTVSGQLLVRGQRGLVVLWQAIEYIFNQNIVKLAQRGSGSSITVCPGPICMYRKDVLLSLGGFKGRTLVEDFDLTMEVIQAGYEAEYDPAAIAWTSTPTTCGALKRQRVRWYRGNLQVLRLYKNMLLHKRFGVMGLFWLPYSVLLGFITSVLDVMFLLVLAVLAVLSPKPFSFLEEGIIFYLALELIKIVQYLFALALNNQLNLKTFLTTFTIKPYELILTWTRLIAIYREIRGAKLSWNA